MSGKGKTHCSDRKTVSFFKAALEQKVRTMEVLTLWWQYTPEKKKKQKKKETQNNRHLLPLLLTVQCDGAK